MRGSFNVRTNHQVMRLLSSPERHIGTLIAFQIVALVAIPFAFSLAPPLDVVEGLVWAPHWLIGTYKHPPLPAWLIEISVLLTHNVILGPYLVSQIGVGLAYWFIYRLGRLVMDPMRAAAGTILMAGSYYFTAPTLEFNHNVVQLPLWSGTLLLYAHLRQAPDRWRYWLALGLIGGVGLYGKYSYAILLVLLFALALYEKPTRAFFKTARPYLGLLLAVLIVLPHLFWLVSHTFEPFFYALDRGAETKTSGPLMFLAVQVFDHLPMAIIAAVAFWGTSKRQTEAEDQRDERQFLRIVSFAPIAMTALFFILSGSSAKDMWGMPMFTPLGLWLVMEFGREITEKHLRHALLASIGLVALVATGFIVQSLYPYHNKPLRSRWPMVEIAQAVETQWKEHTSEPLVIIGGSPFAAGLAALGRADRPVVMIGTTLRHSPWINMADIREKGIAFVFDRDESVPELCPANAFKTTVTLSDPLLPALTIIACPPPS
jgi:4-amino-4-deoxy-L-arabinose transferase-like glycosyltransferase